MKRFLLIFIITVLLFPNPFCSISKAHEVDAQMTCSFTNLPIVMYESYAHGNFILDPIVLINNLVVVVFSNLLPAIPLVLVIFFLEDYLKRKKVFKKHQPYLFTIIWILTAVIFFGALYFIGYMNPLEISD